jgi:hypothetical protein
LLKKESSAFTLRGDRSIRQQTKAFGDAVVWNHCSARVKKSTTRGSLDRRPFEGLPSLEAASNLRNIWLDAGAWF